MKTLALFLLVALAAQADELIKNAQAQLKEEGYYIGEVTGLNSPETVAAIKRFQQRNGLENSGQLDAATLEALGLAGGAAAAPVEPERSPASPVDLRRDATVVEKDREFLDRQPAPAAPVARPPGGAVQPGPYSRVFSRTPYASAPVEVQRDIVVKAQRFLRENGGYRESVDGVPGPALEEALLAYQRRIRAPLTGRLDLETLAAMRLLPGRGGAPARAGGEARPRTQPLRGEWVR